MQDWTGDTGTRIGVEAIGSSEVVASTDQVTVAVSNGLQTETLTLTETATAQSSDQIALALPLQAQYSELAVAVVPLAFALYNNAPNPFNPATVVRFSLPDDGAAQLTVYNLLGQEVAVLTSGLKTAGEHAVRWDGRDLQGRPAASGVYFYRLVTVGAVGQSVVLTRKMTLLR